MWLQTALILDGTDSLNQAYAAGTTAQVLLSVHIPQNKRRGRRQTVPDGIRWKECFCRKGFWQFLGKVFAVCHERKIPVAGEKAAAAIGVWWQNNCKYPATWVPWGILPRVCASVPLTGGNIRLESEQKGGERRPVLLSMWDTSSQCGQ